MAEKEYNSRIDKPQVHTTSKGGSYVRPFDVVRSEKGRATIKSHAAAAGRSGGAATHDNVSLKNSKD